MAEPRLPLTPKDELVLAAIQRAGKDGLVTSGISGMTVKMVEHSIRKLLRRELVFKAKLSHKTVRHFVTQAWADAFQAHKLPSDTKARASVRTKCHWDPKDPNIKPHLPTNADGSPAYKLTVIPRSVPPEGTAIRTTFYQPW